MTSHLDTMSHEITCTSPKCGYIIKETYRRLRQLDKVVCPKCGTTIDIRESKRTGEIGSWLNTVAELDKKIDKEE